MQVLRPGYCRAQPEHVHQDSSSTAIQHVFIQQLAGHHPGFEALLLPLMMQMPSAELLYEQCQVALKGPKVGHCIKKAGVPFQGLDQTAPLFMPSSAQLSSAKCTDIGLPSREYLLQCTELPATYQVRQAFTAVLSSADLIVDSESAVQGDMGAVLEILLSPQGHYVSMNYRGPVIAAALQSQDPKSGLTLLGQAVAAGHSEAVAPILDAAR